MSQEDQQQTTQPRQNTQLPQPAQRALEAYRAKLAASHDSTPVAVAWAPGRVNLIGEHTDYNEGFVLPVAIDRVVALAGRPTSGAETTCYSVHHNERAQFQTDHATLLDQPMAQNLPLWSRYVRGVLAELAAAATPVMADTPTFAAAIAGDVPLGGGMSSSAALEVATATFAAALGGPSFDPMTTARLCQRAEQRSAGAQVGIMDQATSCLGRAGEAILLDCRSLKYEYVPVNMPGIILAVYDTRVAHSHASSGYNERRRQCEEATKLLAEAIHTDQPQRAVHSLRDITQDDLSRYSSKLPDVLQRRVRHVVSENERVQRAVAALRAGQADELGQLLYASHASLRDDYEVSSPELDAVVEIARRIPGVLGARMMGGGFGGSAIILVQQTTQPALAAALAEQYPQRTGRQGEMHTCVVSGGPAYSTIQLDIP